MTTALPIKPHLQGVPETMLMTVWNRSAFASGGTNLLDDPLTQNLLARLDYDFRGHFGASYPAHAIRSRYIDERVRDFLARHPGARVVALGEGLETQFWRVDDGLVQWYSVDLPESIAIRRELLPASERNHLIACSALDKRWLAEVASQGDGPVFISAAGLLMYFEEQQVVELLHTIVQTFGEGELSFDTIPQWFSRKTLKGWKPTRHYTAPPMPFGIALGQVHGLLTQVPGMTLRDCKTFAEPWPRFMPFFALLSRLSWFKNNIAPGLVHASFTRQESSLNRERTPPAFHRIADERQR